MGLLPASPPTRRLRLLQQLRPRRVLKGLPPKRRDRQQPSGSLTETALRNIALEAVRVGNYYAEDQEEVYRYIAEQYEGLLADKKWQAKNRHIWKENGLSQRYTVQQILRKEHEADGFDIFVDPDEAILAKEAAERGPREGPAELPPGKIAELSDGVAAIVAAAAGEGDPVGPEEVAELLEECAAAGEVGAAVYCGERLEAMHDGQLPATLAERAFVALKPLLRPSAAQPIPRLEGPWCVAPSGRAGKPNERRGLGLLLQRLVAVRKAQELAAGGAAAERAAATAARDEALSRLSKVVAEQLAKDAEVASADRRAQLAEIVERLCRDGGLSVSRVLAHAVVQRLVDTGVLSSRGRGVWLNSETQVPASDAKLSDLADDLKGMEELARRRLERRTERHNKKHPQKQDRDRQAKRHKSE